jgi:hypothetical protein
MSMDENEGYGVLTAQLTVDGWANVDAVRDKVRDLRDALLAKNPDRTLSAYYTAGGPFDLVITTNIRPECLTSLVVALSQTRWMHATAVQAVRAEHVRDPSTDGFICC